MGIASAFGSTLIMVAALVGALLVVGGAVFRLVGMYLTDRVLSGAEFGVILSVLVLLMGGAIAVGGALSLALLLLVAALALLITLMPQISGAIRGRQLLHADIRKYEEALKRQPDVPYPHLKLAQIYQQQEDWERAIEHYQAYIDQHEISAEPKRSLERCLERKRIRDMGLRRCPVCGAENQRGNVRCVACGFYLKGMAEIIGVLVTPGMMRVWKWLIVLFLAPALVVGLFAQIIPPTVTMAMLACSVIATVIFLYGRMSPEGG